LIEAQDPLDAVTFHNRDMKSVPRRKRPSAEEDVPGPLNVSPVDWKHVVDHTKHCIEGWLYRVPTVDGSIAVENLLQDFGVSHEAFIASYKTLECPLSIELVGVGGADEIHRHV